MRECVKGRVCERMCQELRFLASTPERMELTLTEMEKKDCRTRRRDYQRLGFEFATFDSPVRHGSREVT